MAEYIDKEFVIDTIEELKSKALPKALLFDHLKKVIEIFPTEDFAPVKHGHWVYNQNGHDWGLGAWECSLCHSVNNNLPIDKRFSPYVYAGSKYCPNCGAKMDGGENS